MGFLPVKCLKVIVFIGSICSIAISLALLTLTIYVQVQKKSVISSASQATVTASLISLYISSIVFLLLGAAGLAGSIKSSSKKQSKGTCLLALYSVGIFVFFVLFLGGTIFFFVGPEAIFGTNCTSGSKTNLISDLYNVSQEAYAQFCGPSCPCKVDAGSYLFNELTLSDRILNGANAVSKFSECPVTPNGNFDILATLEDILSCGGWCALSDPAQSNPTRETNTPIYYRRFQDINSCNTQDCIKDLVSCHDKFYDFMTGSGRLVGFGCLAAVLVCFINIIAVCCICFHPSKVKSGSNFYSRMIEMD